MTDAASKDDSENNLAAFELGVYANQFLWNLDQAFVAESEPHRNMALGLIERLSAIGAAFTEMKNNAPFENFLREIRGYLPATLRSQRVEALNGFISQSFNVDSDLSEGERWYQFLDPFGQEREKLRKILFDDTVQTLQQRKWFRLGWLIDAGRHPPDTGHCLYKFQPTRNRRRLPPALAQPNLINDDEPEVPMFRTFEAGELSPQGEWWQSVFGLGQQLDVPCNSNEPDQSTASSVVDAVEQMIASVRETIAPLQSDARHQSKDATSSLLALSDGQQQSASGSPTVGNAPKDQEVPPLTGGGAGVLKGDSTEQRGEDSAVIQTNETIDSTGEPSQLDQNRHQDCFADNPDSATGKKPKEKSEQERGTRIGRWTIYHHQVQFDGLSRVEMTHNYRCVFECLLKHEHNAVDQTTLIDIGWGLNSGKDAKNLKPLISKLQKQLRNYLKDTLGKQLPKKLFLCKAKGKDLCYQLDPSVR